MKKICLFVPAAIILFSTCRQHKSQPQNNSQNKRDSTARALSFYKRFEGTIAGQPVVMHLHKNENKITGTYYYRKTGGWITLTSDSTSADSIFLSEYSAVYNINNDTDEDTVRPQLRCRLQNDLLTGVWLSKDRKTSYPINLKEIYPSGSYQFTFESYTDSLKAFPNKQGSPVAEMDKSFVVCKNNDWLNSEIKRILEFDSSLDFKNGFIKARDQYFNDYKKDVDDEKSDTTYLDFLNYANSRNIYVRYNENNFVILEAEDYMYSGGAHGSYGSWFSCFEVANKKKINLSDILSADSATLQPIVEKNFRIQYNVKGPLKEVLFENYIAANDNFYFNEKGIGFLYNPYEVASFAQGQIDVFIPFTALQKFIQPEFKRRMNLNF